MVHIITMKRRPLLASLLIVVGCLNVHAQRTFTLGAKIGLGGSPFPLNATFKANGATSGVRPMTIFTTGFLTQYMVNDFMGIESGAYLTHYGYYRNETSAWQNLIGEVAVVQVFNYQVPVVLLHKIKMPGDPFKYVKLAGGTSIDWLTGDGLTTYGKALSLKNLHCGVRLGREKVKGSRIEYGLEFQYSFNRFYLESINYNQVKESLSSRLSMLTLNFYYLFWNKALTHEDAERKCCEAR
jgi:hypothetical protein